MTRSPLLSSSTWVAWLWVISVSLAAFNAPAAPADAELVVSGSGECPAPAQVVSTIAELVPQERQGALRGVEIRVRDEGETYAVELTTADGQFEKIYEDAARQCEQRARFAAVFAVLTLLPPELWSDLMAEALPQAPPPPPPQPPPPRPAPRAIRTRREPPAPLPASLRFEAGGFLLLAPENASHDGVAVAGPELRAAWGQSLVAAVVSAGFSTRGHLRLDELEAELGQLPLSAGVRLRAPGPIEAALQLGVAGTWYRARGTSPLHPRAASGFAWGARVGGLVAWSLSDQLRPYLELSGTYLPDTPELMLEPRGSVGRLPTIWLGVHAGLGLELDWLR